MATSTRSRRQELRSGRRPADPRRRAPPPRRSSRWSTCSRRPAAVRIELWDDSAIGPADPIGTIRVHSRDALRRILWAPGELGLAHAHVSGDLDVEGDMVGMLGRSSAQVAPRDQHLGLPGLAPLVAGGPKAGAIGRPLPPPPEEAHQRGRRHSKRRDAEAIATTTTSATSSTNSSSARP